MTHADANKDIGVQKFSSGYALFIVGILAVLLAGCDDKIPVRDEDYNKAYGIIAGQSNDLRIGGVLFRFPPQYLPDAYAGGGTLITAGGSFRAKRRR